MADFVKMFRKNDPGGIGAGEPILAITTALPRASIVGATSVPGTAGVLDEVIGQRVRDSMASRALDAAGEPVGDAATWPVLDNLALVLTDRRLVLYDAVKGLRKLQGPVGEYALDRVAGVTFEKKTIMNVVRFSFADGSVRELDAAKGQHLEEFVEALARAKTG